MFIDSFPQMDFHYEGGGGFPLFVAVVLVILMILLHAACGIAVLDSAKRYTEKHGDTVLLSRLIWGFIGLLGGPCGLGLYWLLHLSTLNPAQSAISPPTPPAPAPPESRA